MNDLLSSQIDSIYNIMIVGVGGQGAITLGKFFQEYGMHEQSIEKVYAMESRGVSQREGSVYSFVRYQLSLDGEQAQVKAILSPVPPIQGINLMIAMDSLEFLRNLRYCSPTGTVFVNDHILFPKSAISQKIQIQTTVTSWFEKISQIYPELHIYRENFSHMSSTEANRSSHINQSMVNYIAQHLPSFFKSTQFQKLNTRFFQG